LGLVSGEAESDYPPRWWVSVADMTNFMSNVFLMAAFFVGALLNSVQVDFMLQAPGVPNAWSLALLQSLFVLQGLLLAIGSLFMIAIMAATQPELGGGPRGCVQFALLMVGGVFFAFSGIVFPPCITNIRYLMSSAVCTHPAAAGTPYVWNAMAHYGITCAMIGTSIGFFGVLPAPKNKLVSPFWGVTFYWLGAWTIGITKFWGPMLLGGFAQYQNEPTFDFNAPAAAWSMNWWSALVGATFLTIAASIFVLLNKSPAKPAPAPTDDLEMTNTK